MATVAIRKKSLYTWEHFYDDRPVYVTNIFNINNGGNETFNIVEYRGAKLDSVPIANVTVYDDTGAGTPETFATFSDLNTRLGILKYPPFRTSDGGGGVASVQQGDGIEVDATDADNPIVSIRISADADNVVTIGTDGGLYVSASGMSDQNNFVRKLNIYDGDLSGIGTIEEQICEYILSLPEEERTILETDSKWNVVIIDTPITGRIHTSVFTTVFN